MSTNDLAALNSNEISIERAATENKIFMPDIYFIPQTEFSRVSNAAIDKYTRLALLADMCRLNALAVVKQQVGASRFRLSSRWIL